VAFVSESAASAAIRYQRKLFWEGQNKWKKDSPEFADRCLVNRAIAVERFSEAASGKQEQG